MIARLAFIAQNGIKGDPAVEYARRILLLEEAELNNEWAYGDVGPAEDHDPSKGPYIVIPHLDEEEDFVLHFSLNVPGLSNWYFRPGDPDYFPSIPHGHWNDLEFPKLDAYLGWVYDHFGKQIKRESRKNIVTLWNDEGFRLAAAKAVNHYLQTYPKYSGWRVANPLVLPKKRKR